MCRPGLQGCDRAPTAQLQSPQCRLSTVWIHKLALNTWQSDAFAPVAASGHKRVEAKWSSKVVFLSSLWAFRQYKHHLQSLQVNPIYALGVCQSLWLQVTQFLVITVLETISRTEVCVRKRTKPAITSINRGNWGESSTLKVLIYWISILLE